MHLFEYGTYPMSYFNKVHVEAIIFWIIVGIVLLIIPYIFTESQKRYFNILLGFSALGLKLLDGLYRYYVEGIPWQQVVPLNLCNLAIIFGGLYLITKRKFFWHLLYFFFSGAVLAILMPDFKTYHTHFYVYLFIGTHTIEVFLVPYIFIHCHETIRLRGLIEAIIVYLILMVIAYIYNSFFGTNFMFIQTYIISAISFIKPIQLYRFLFITIFILSMVIFWLPFARKGKEENIEEVMI